MSERAAPRSAHAGGASLGRRRWIDGYGMGWDWEVPLGRGMRLVFPLAGFLVGVVLADLLLGATAEVLGFLVLYHSPFGMYAGFPVALALGFDPVLVAVVIAILHGFGALLLVWNLPWLRSIPWLGARVAWLEDRTRRAWDRKPRLRHLGVFGLFVYVVVPITGTGLVTGCIVGRLAGLPWFPVWVAVFAGGMLRVAALILVVYAGWGFLAPE